MAAVADIQGPKGSLANFLKDLGPALLKKYEPKAIVVFSAHWETNNGALVTDYGEENPLLMDCEWLLQFYLLFPSPSSIPHRPRPASLCLSAPRLCSRCRPLSPPSDLALLTHRLWLPSSTL